MNFLRKISHLFPQGGRVAYRAYVIGCLVAVLGSTVTGCSSKQVLPPQQTARTETPYLTMTDDAGRVVTLAKKPERVVILSTSFLDLYYAVGGKAVGKVESKTVTLPPEAKALPGVGQVANINLEQLISLQPDFVIAFQGMHEKLVPILESSNIPVVILRMKSYEDVLTKAKLFGEIAGTQEQAQRVTEDIDGRIKRILSRLPTQAKKVVILHATAKNVTVELDSSIAGSIAKMLHVQNIAAGSKAIEGNPDAIPYSMEKLVEGDPDMILVTMMGNKEEIERRMRADVESNPAWASLRAVRNKQVFFLPMEYFLLNPGVRYDEAVAYMAKVVYPEIYANIR